MLDDFALTKISEMESEKRIISEKLEKVLGSERSLKNQIEDLIRQSDVGMEVFSPRSNRVDKEMQINSLRTQLHSLEQQESTLNHDIEIITNQISKYQQITMAQEGTLSELYPDEEAKHICSIQNDLHVTLDQIQSAYEEIDQNPEMAKSILKNLSYYLKALITETQSDVSRET